MSVGFAGDVKVWKYEVGEWKADGEVNVGSRKKAGETWAVSLSDDGKFLASTTHDGRINVWDIADTGSREKIREFETKGSFGMSIDMVRSRLLTSRKHQANSILRSRQTDVS